VKTFKQEVIEHNERTNGRLLTSLEKDIELGIPIGHIRVLTVQILRNKKNEK
jgi:hypothetical protein